MIALLLFVAGLTDLSSANLAASSGLTCQLEQTRDGRSVVAAVLENQTDRPLKFVQSHSSAALFRLSAWVERGGKRTKIFVNQPVGTSDDETLPPKARRDYPIELKLFGVKRTATMINLRAELWSIIALDSRSQPDQWIGHLECGSVRK